MDAVPILSLTYLFMKQPCSLENVILSLLYRECRYSEGNKFLELVSATYLNCDDI